MELTSRPPLHRHAMHAKFPPPPSTPFFSQTLPSGSKLLSSLVTLVSPFLPRLHRYCTRREGRWRKRSR